MRKLSGATQRLKKREKSSDGESKGSGEKGQ
jgi:hypothetical protein